MTNDKDGKNEPGMGHPEAAGEVHLASIARSQNDPGQGLGADFPPYPEAKEAEPNSDEANKLQ
jgi:hypothetical protein